MDAERSSSQSATLHAPLELKWRGVFSGQGIVNYSSPVAFGDRVYIGSSNGKVLAFDLSAAVTLGGLAAPLAQFQTDAPIYGSPAFAVVATQSRIYIGSTDGNLYCLKADDLSLVWKQATGNSVFSSPLVYTISGSSLVVCSSQDGSVRAFDAATGAPAWTFMAQAAVFASPAFDGSRLFVPSYDKHLYALDALSGAVVWQANLTAATRSTPALSGGQLINLAVNGVISRYAPANGTPIGIAFGLGATNSSSLAAAGLQAIVGLENGRILAVNPKLSGPVSAIAWQNTLSPDAIYSSPAIANGKIYVGSNDGTLYVLDLATGKNTPADNLSFGGSVQVSPAIAQNTLLAAASSGDLRAYGMPVARIALAGPAEAANGQTLVYSLQALDSDGNLVPSYAGSVNLSLVGGGQAIFSASPRSPVAFDAGVASVTVTFSDAYGAQKLQVQDSLKNAIVGSVDIQFPKQHVDPCAVPQTCYQLVGTVGPNSGPGSLTYPFGIAVTTDLAGNVYVVDQNLDQVKKYDNTGAFILEWGGSGNTDGKFNGATMIATDSAGAVYVTDFNGIQKFDPSGAFILKFGQGLFLSPAGIAISKAGDVYVSDNSDHYVQQFTLTGQFVRKWGGAGHGAGQFSDAEGLAVDSLGNVYVTDLANQRVEKFSATGAYITEWSTGANYPWGVAVDTCDRVYVADDFGSSLHKYSSTGTLIADFGNIAGEGYAYLGTIGVGLDGSVYAAIDNNQVLKYGACGTVALSSINIVSSPLRSHLRRKDALSPTPTPLLFALLVEPEATATVQATPEASVAPSLVPTLISTPTALPTVVPSIVATLAPTELPTALPTLAPTAAAMLVPTPVSTAIPTLEPVLPVTAVPTEVPTLEPTVTAVPTLVPTATSIPTLTATETSVPTPVPALALSGVGASPNSFSPHNNESSTLSFTVNKAASVTISIYDKQDRLVRQWTGLAVPAGSGRQVWDGKDAGGHDVPPGLDGYRVEIVAAAGTETAPGSVSVGVNP